MHSTESPRNLRYSRPITVIQLGDYSGWSVYGPTNDDEQGQGSRATCVVTAQLAGAPVTLVGTVDNMLKFATELELGVYSWMINNDRSEWIGHSVQTEGVNGSDGNKPDG